jgi:AhpD family alkylhydroperoxidase
MQPRLKYTELAPDGYRAMNGLERYVRSSGLEPSILELVKLRSSQINGCAYCIDMHTKDARVRGETEQRLYALSAWRETPFFTDRERAALAWTEAVTQVSETHVSDDVYELAHRYFGEKELVDLTFAIVAINGWNRLAISFRTVPGSYQPAPLDRKEASGEKEHD